MGDSEILLAARGDGKDIRVGPARMGQPSELVADWNQLHFNDLRRRLRSAVPSFVRGKRVFPFFRFSPR